MEQSGESTLYFASTVSHTVMPFIPTGELSRTISGPEARTILDHGDFICVDTRQRVGSPDGGYGYVGPLQWRCFEKGTTGSFIVDGSTWGEDSFVIYPKLIEKLEEKKGVKGLTILFAY